MPLISVVVVTYNAASILKRTLDTLTSLRRILGQELEIIVIDGASTDRTVSVMETSRLADVIVSEPDNGIYDAMNKGAALAQGEWLHFLNAGDSMRSDDDIRAVVNALRNAGSDSSWAVCGAQNLRGGKGAPTRIKNIPHSWLKHLMGMQSHCHQASWFRRDAFIAIGGFRLDLSTAADFASIVQFGLLSRPLVIPQLAVDYLGGGVSDVSALDGQMLLHRVRVKVLHLSERMSKWDLGLTYAVVVFNFSKITFGKVRRKYN